MKAVKITRRTLAAEAAKHWRKQYGDNAGPDKTAIQRALERLGENPAPDDVDKAIGNQSWTRVPNCDGCDKENPRSVVRVGQKSDYESNTAFLCAQCLQEAVGLYRRKVKP